MLVQKVGIVNSIIKKLKKRAYPVSTRLPIKTVCFSELIQAIHTTHVPILSRQQWRDILKVLPPSGASSELLQRANSTSSPSRRLELASPAKAREVYSFVEVISVSFSVILF